MKTGTTQKTFGARLASLLSYTSHVFMVVYLVMAITMHWSFIIPSVMYAHLAFRGELNGLYGLGPVYWITKRDSRRFAIGIGTMHETNHPWRTGRGVYAVVAKYCFQIGLCRKQQLGEVDGTLSAVQGRYLDLEPREIGNWGVQEKAGAGKLTA